MSGVLSPKGARDGQLITGDALVVRLANFVKLPHTVFAMPSFRETFGIVYLEALSQGLPIIHSRGQGIDGLFAPNGVSEGVDPHLDTSLADAITRLAGRDPSIRKLCIAEANRFSWDSVAHMYARLYGSVCTGNTLEISR